MIDESILKLENCDGPTYQKLADGIISAVRKSFQEELKPKATQSEIRRRVLLCVDIVRELRDGDKPWSWQHIVDELPKALRGKLDGIKWSPEKKRTLWVPGDSDNRIIVPKY